MAGWALLALSACDEARPKVHLTPPGLAAPSASNAPSVANAPGSSARIDSPPAGAAPERRLRQRQLGSQLVIDTEGEWAPECSIHRACQVAPRALELCAPERNAEVWSAALAARAEHFTDPQVAFKGQLVMSDSAFSTAVGCSKAHCCNSRRAKMVLAGPPYDLELIGLGCAGDESRLCCATSARGEEVIATGRLRYETGRLLLDSPELCRTGR